MPTPIMDDSYLRAARRLFTAATLEDAFCSEVTTINQVTELVSYLSLEETDSLIYGDKEQNVNLLLLFAAIHQEI